MNQELDIEIYSAICDRLNASEIYLGHVGYAFKYTKTEYQATCTEAFPFNAFDKVICELLQIEEHLSFHEIGRILGLNVGDIESGKSIKDNAEYEILMEALQSLADFSMIEGGDIYFSRCRLTAIGREYAEKKHKFKKTENKPFIIYFDKTTGNHKQAKENFEFADGHIYSEPNDDAVIGETELKEIAAVQVPAIYNPAKLYSFTDEVVVDSDDYSISMSVGITFDLHREQFNFHCYDKSAKKVHIYFTTWLSTQVEITSELIEELKNNIPISDKPTPTLFPVLKDQYPNGKLKAAINNLIEFAYIDQYLVLNNLKLFLNASEKVDFYLCIPILTELLYSSVAGLIQQSENNHSRYFIVFPKEVNPSMRKGIEQLISLSKGISNLYIMQQDVKSFLMISNKELNPFYMELVDTSINEIPIKIAERLKYDAKATKFEKYLLTSFSNEMALTLCSNANDLINSDMETPVTKDQLERLSEIEFKLMPFISIGEQAQTVAMTIELITDFKTQRIQLLNERLQQQLNELVASIEDVKELQEITKIKKAITAIEQQMVVSDASLVNGIAQAISLLEFKKEIIEEQKRIYSFIIDTNILLEDPEVILRVDKKHAIIIAAKVLDELDKFKMDKNLSAIVSRAVKIIQQDKNRNIRHNKGRPKLLPPDLNQKTPDNLILSVAIQYHNNHGILITSDNLLSVKAQNVLDLKVMNLQEFKTKFDQSIKS